MNYLLAGLLLAVAGLGLLLANEQSEHEKTKRVHAEEYREMANAVAEKTAELRAKDGQLALANKEITDGQIKLNSEKLARAADARRAVASLHATAEALGNRKRPDNPEAGRYFDEAATAGRLVGECSDRRTEVAEAATDLRNQVIGLQSYVLFVCLPAAGAGP